MTFDIAHEKVFRIVRESTKRAGRKKPRRNRDVFEIAQLFVCTMGWRGTEKAEFY